MFKMRRKGAGNAFVIIASAVLVFSFFYAAWFNLKNGPVQAPVASQEQAQEQIPAASPEQVANFNDQLLMATLWMQRSAEYHALCYQAYNIALERISRAVAVKRAGLDNPGNTENVKPFALVLDLDETVLDNSAMAVRRYAENTSANADVAFSIANWAAWSAADEVQAMPGAVKFLQTVDKLGVQIFYVTNRFQDWQDGVVKSLTRLGFPQLEPEHLLLLTETGDKKPRFKQVLENYNILVYLGDNLGDMNLESYDYDAGSDARVAAADANALEFGVTRVVLPNPMYGNWESALADGYDALPLVKQDEIRRASLRPAASTSEPEAPAPEAEAK